MTPHFEKLQNCLKKLPGLGFRSAERLALHLLVESPQTSDQLIDLLRSAKAAVGACKQCGNIAEGECCEICEDSRRERKTLCVVEHIPDLMAIERSGVYRGLYHVLHGKLSPLHGVGPEQLNLKLLMARLEALEIDEIIFALPNDIEGEATCHFLQEEYLKGTSIRMSRIGFGLPSGGGLLYADSTTLRSAMEGRRQF